MRKCRHKSWRWMLKIVWFADTGSFRLVPVSICSDCRAWLPLGDSNDAPPEVRVEIAAALRAIEWQEMSNVPTGYDRFDWCPDGKDERLCGRCETIYLARVICSGDLP